MPAFYGQSRALATVLTHLALLAALAGCGRKAAPLPTPAAGGVRFAYARGLQIEPAPDGYVLRLSAHFDDARQSITYRLGESLERDGRTIQLPVRRMICLSSTHLGFLAEIDSLDGVVGVMSRSTVASQQVLDAIDAGTMREVGEGPQFDVETALALRPDLVVIFGVSESDLETYRALERAGIPVLVCADYTESTPLGRAEWVKLFGLLTGKLKVAEARFGEIRDAYEELAKESRIAEPKPTVLLNAAFQGVWYVPGGDSYMAHFLADAGTRYLWADDRDERVKHLSFEAVLAKARDADYWLNVGFWRSLAEGKANDERYALFRPFQAGEVYNHFRDRGGATGSDFYERGAVRPDLVLADLVKIFHPTLVPDHSFIWYEKLPAE